MKSVLMLFSVIGLGLGACSSNKGSFEENEKRIQDSIDQLNTEKGFDDLEKQGGGDAAKDSLNARDSQENQEK